MRRPAGHVDRTAEVVALQMDSTIIDALERLPRQVRSVVLLRFVAGSDYSEVAKQLGIDREKARSLEMRGWRALQVDSSLASLHFDEQVYFWRHRSALSSKYGHIIGPALRQREDRDLRMFEFFDYVRSRRNSPCEFCGTLFSQVLGGRDRHYCSNKCRQASYRARQRALRQ